MDPHRLAEERSIAYHRAVADRLRGDPVLVERARARVREWLANGSVASCYAMEWERVLSLPREAMMEALVDPSEAARARRQASPFAGFLDPRERWRLWREVRDRGAA